MNEAELIAMGASPMDANDSVNRIVERNRITLSRAAGFHLMRVVTGVASAAEVGITEQMLRDEASQANDAAMDPRYPIYQDSTPGALPPMQVD
jgi:hypothetical protein